MTTTVLPLICHGVPPEGLARNLVGRTVTAYAMPPKHSLEAAWLFTLYFEDGGNLEFWSEFYNTAGWNELGVLVVSSLGEAVEGRSMNLEQFRVEIPSIRIAGCRKLLCEEDGFLAEYGLLLAGEDEENLIIAAGISPGSVSVRLPSDVSNFSPLLDLPYCTWQELDA
jgi:hypothetical protein